MVIEKIIIKNFRNLKKIEIEPCNKINYIIGENAQGKTNILESIYFGAYCKSFRTNNIKNLQNNNNTIDIIYKINSKKVNHILNIKYQDKNKIIKIDNNISNIKNITEIYNTVLYYPSEISLLLKFPSYRRNLIDKSIYNFKSNYLDYCINYLKCLKNRNICLKNGKDDYVWKENLIELSFIIIKNRKKYIDEINAYIKSINMYDEENYELSYNCYDTDNLKDNLIYLYENSAEKDKRNGYTSVGPHTDDIIFLINRMNLSTYGSEGQKKTFILLYKYAQIIDYFKKKNDYPVFLVDDLASEIDKSRENFIISEIVSKCSQSFLTTSYYKNEITDNIKIFNIKDGVIN